MDAITLTSEETLQQIIDRFWDTIPPVWNKVRGNVRTIATENYDITLEQFHILRHIRRGTCLVSELAKIQQISRSAISQAVDALVEKDLICRHQDISDRRYVQLELTPQGTELLNAIFQANRIWMMEKLAALSSDEMERVTGALDILKSTLYPVIA